MSQRTRIHPEKLRSILSRLPKAPLAQLPTPLEECPRLSKALSSSAEGLRIFIKRDDLTGLALGGNKVRHMEFIMGDALARGCDAYVYADKSNAGRATAAACAKVGLKCVLVVPGPRQSTPLQGNMLLARALGAEMVFLDSSEPRDVQGEVGAIQARLKEDGRKPYSLSSSPLAPHYGVISYLEATLELERQLGELGIHKAHLYLVNGHSQAGLQLGAKLLGLPWKVTGVAVGQPFEQDRPLADWSRLVADHLGLPMSIDSEEIDTTFAYEGPGYGILTEGCAEAIALTGSAEGIILDPSYTGKAMAALIEDSRKGRTASDEAVVFIHTGGIPVLFESASEVSCNLEPHGEALGGVEAG